MRNRNTGVKSILVSDTPQEPSGPTRLPPLPGEPDPDAVFAQCLRAAREAAGLTQQQLAGHLTRLGYSMRQTTISKIEAGQRPVWLGEAVALADAVGASLAELVVPLPAPGELAEAIAERAGSMRRLAIADAHSNELAAAMVQAHREQNAAKSGVDAANQKIESLMRRRREPLN